MANPDIPIKTNRSYRTSGIVQTRVVVLCTQDLARRIRQEEQRMRGYTSEGSLGCHAQNDGEYACGLFQD
eukprot:3520881-Pyramimonas_sp.AAC.1